MSREIPDHEFPHIVEVDGEYLRCVCGASCHIADWLTWLPRHGKECAPAKSGDVLLESPLGTQQLACGNRVPVENPTTIRVQ